MRPSATRPVGIHGMVEALLVSLLLVAILAAWMMLRLRKFRTVGRHRRIYNALVLPNVAGDHFEPSQVGLLPLPAKRYLRHAIETGTPLALSADLFMTGQMRPAPDADWIGFEARERVCVGRGFLWQARLEAIGRVPVEGADWLWQEDAACEYFIAGIFPLVRVSDEHLFRSAAGRLLIETIWLPGALTPSQGARWTAGDEYRATVELPEHPAATGLTVTVADSGALLEASMLRCHGGEHGQTGLTSYGMRVEEEGRFGGFVVPTRVVASWGFGTDDAAEILRIKLEDVRWF